MPKLVKARFKSVEHMPQWAKCCAAMIARQRNRGEFIADLDNYVGPYHAYSLCCPDCGYTHNPMPKSIMNMGVGKYCPLECLDLDEGEYNATAN